MAKTATYTYDARKLRASLQHPDGALTTYTYDVANQLLKEEAPSGVTSYTYELAGNRTKNDAPAAITYYTWDQDGRLASAEPPSGVVTFTYNAEGKRVQKETPVDTIGFYYDENRLLMELDSAGATDLFYTSTTDEYGDLLSEYDGADNAYHTYDALGSTDALLNDAEAATDRYTYRAFGTLEFQSGTSDSHFTFVGQQNYYKDEELDLYFAGARHLDPATGQWTSKDPIGIEAQDPNYYRYGGNNPTNVTDPSGKSPDGKEQEVLDRLLHGTDIQSWRDNVKGAMTIPFKDLPLLWRRTLTSTQSSPPAGYKDKLKHFRIDSGIPELTDSSEPLWMWELHIKTRAKRIAADLAELERFEAEQEAIKLQEANLRAKGWWTESDVIRAYAEKYGNDEKSMRALLLIMSQYELKHGTQLWVSETDVDHDKRIIYIAENEYWWNRDADDAAAQLHQVLSDIFWKGTKLPESWEGWSYRMLGATGKTVGGSLSVVGGALLLVALEPTLLTKVGGVGAIGFGANTTVEGITQFGRRAGGINVVGEVAGAYGQYMSGDEGEASARYWIGWSAFFFETAGGGGLGRIGKVPLRELPAASKAALQEAYIKMAEKWAPGHLASWSPGQLQRWKRATAWREYQHFKEFTKPEAVAKLSRRTQRNPEARSRAMKQAYEQRYTGIEPAFNTKQIQKLMTAYEGQGHHAILTQSAAQQYLGIPKGPGTSWGRKLRDVDPNIMKPEEISFGRFYERHYFADPDFKGAALGKGLSSWSGQKLGLQKATGLERLWLATPGQNKGALAVGGLYAVGGQLSPDWEDEFDEEMMLDASGALGTSDYLILPQAAYHDEAGAAIIIAPYDNGPLMMLPFDREFLKGE